MRVRGCLLSSYLLKFVLVGHPHCLHVVLKVIILCIQRVDHLFMWDVKSSQNLGRRKPLWAAQSSCSACTSCPRRGRAAGHHPRRSPAPPPSSSCPRRFDNLWNLSLDWSAGTWTQGWNMFCFVFITPVPYQRGILDFTPFETRLKRYTGKCSAFARCLEAQVY